MRVRVCACVRVRMCMSGYACAWTSALHGEHTLLQYLRSRDLTNGGILDFAMEVVM